MGIVNMIVDYKSDSNEEKDLGPQEIVMENNKADVLKTYCDFQRVAIVETANALTKGITYYLIIMATLTGLILTQEGLSKEQQQLALYLSVVVSFFLAIAGASIYWALHKGVHELGQNLKALDDEMFAELQIDNFITRGLKHGLVVMVCSLCVLVTIIIGIYLIAQ